MNKHTGSEKCLIVTFRAFYLAVSMIFPTFATSNQKSTYYEKTNEGPN